MGKKTEAGGPMPKQCQGAIFQSRARPEGHDSLTAAQRLVATLSDGLDHPELWPGLSTYLHNEEGVLEEIRSFPAEGEQQNLVIQILLVFAEHTEVGPARAIEHLTSLMAIHDQSPLLQGALFYLYSILHPNEEKFNLRGKICQEPFNQLTITENSALFCCQAWLPTSLGDPRYATSGEIWNGGTAQAIRESILDGSYRYCNKIICPVIQQNQLKEAGDHNLPDSVKFSLERSTNKLEDGPEIINLCYDRTCNLSCPSCREDVFAANSAMRRVYASMESRLVLPLLEKAKIVIITGSGDPFASKTFRNVMKELTAEKYPNLRFRIMTNAMLLTPQQWNEFPSLHYRIEELKVSVDAAHGPTHERLRRGAKWSTMMDNLIFAGELTAKGYVEKFELSFVVQKDNYREMGDFVDLARAVGAGRVYFARLMNWEQFSDAQYGDMAVFLPQHPQHGDFLAEMQDVRLLDPMVWLGNLGGFVRNPRHEAA